MLLVALVATLSTSFATTLVTSSARAQDPMCPPDRDGCSEEDVAFHWREGFLDAVMIDTGWVPASSPLQVRFAIYLGGETEIDLAGTSLVWWPSPLSVAVPGTPGTGRLSVDYGIEIVARIRFDVTVAGTHYTWEGDIPTGGIPHDLRVAAMSTFDSMLLPPQMPRPISIDDATERYAIYDASLSGVGGIPGVDGGFLLEADAALAATYQTERIEIGDAPSAIVEEGASVVAGPDAGEVDFGAAKDVVIAPVGTLNYDGTVTLYPTFFIEVAGRRFDLPLPTFPVPVADVDREVRFDPVTVHVPLPDARIEPRAIDFGDVDVASVATELLMIRNEGELELTVTPRAARAPFGISPDAIVVAPRSARSVEITFSPTELGEEGAMLFLETDDPDEALVVVRLSGNGVGLSVTDGGASRRDGGDGPSTDGGCACRAGRSGGSSASAIAMLALGLAIFARRRR